MSARTRPPLLDVDKLIDDPDTRILVCCGSGGVGKTTTAAALALRAASRGRRVVVLTIDPARRLAQSLGLSELSNHPRAVDLGADADGQLHAMMLDMRRTFDDMVLAHAGRQRAQQILSNPFYQTISSSFSGTQEYMAMEKLGQLVHDDQWDLVVVDTPPSRSALDFLDAPQRLSTVLDGKIIRMLSAPARAGGLGLKRLVGAGFGLFTKAVSTIIGGQLLADASAFVQAFDSMFGGFRERSRATYELLRSPGTAFLVIAAPEPDALREASYFVDRLSGDEMPLAGLVVNRTHPVLADLPAARALAAAEDLERTASAPLASAVLRLHADRVAVADREKRMLSRFTRAHPAVALIGVPALPSDVHDLDGLREIGHRLAGE
ncbi:ArsA family ATPase [Allokutzneria albata]|uniref:Anion-transporting ATPase, ArsA/GET3 family n=1 Tax=Allokutzneria albata TaxID=211114 RepID=A0A1H0AI15_ALLAB|nr:ArsA-related P-loop ATPase [Allokutzneria albata]SDN32703.1 Anion-transporting ATPase, ArsA/GET3 family [Allokutzneria albata]